MVPKFTFYPFQERSLNKKSRPNGTFQGLKSLTIALLGMVIFALPNSLSAQLCDINYHPSVTFSGGNGVAPGAVGSAGTLVINGPLFSNLITSNCSGTNEVITLWQDAGKTTPWTNSNLTCADIGMTFGPIYVAIHNGNSANESGTLPFEITVSDNTNPTLTCSNQTETVGASCMANVTVSDPSSDNCTTGLMTQYSYTGPSVGNSGAMSPFPNDFTGTLAAGTYMFTYNAQDASGNMNTCTFSLTVSDAAAPTLMMCPTSPSVSADATCVSTTSVLVPTAEDNCVFAYTANVNYPASSFYTDEMVTLTAVSHGGTQQDLTPMLVNANYPLGTTVITFIADDGTVTPTQCVATVTVTDNTGPTFTGAPTTINVNATGCSAAVNFDLAPFIMDNCSAAGTIGVSHTIDAGTAISGTVLSGTYPVGVYAVVYTANDGTNQATHSITLTVVENTAPMATCTGISGAADHFTINLDGTTGMATVFPADIDGGSTDNCGVATLEIALDNDGNQMVSAGDGAFQNSLGLACANVGTVNVLLRVTDVNGNSAVCGTTVTVTDNAPPVAQCQNINIDLDVTGNATIYSDAAQSGATIFNTVDIGSYDICNTISAYGLDASVTGTFAVNSLSFTCADIGTSTIYLQVTDNTGNMNTCSSIIVVSDNIDPTATAMNYTANLDANGNALVSGNEIDNGSVDNPTGGTGMDCNIETYEIAFDTAPTGTPNNVAGSFTDTLRFTCLNAGTYNVWLKVIDYSGNEDMTGPVQVTVADAINPVANCIAAGADFSIPATGTLTLDHTNINNGSTDNCGLDVSMFTVSPSTFGCTDIGSSSTVTLTVFDNAGNMNSCMTSINIVDTDPPIVACNNINITISGTSAVIPASFLGSGADNCQTITNADYEVARSDGMPISFGPTVGFTCANIGTNTVIFRATEPGGNMLSATCIATVNLSDTQAPMVTAPSDITIECGSDTDPCPANTDNPTMGVATATDNCSATALTVACTDFSDVINLISPATYACNYTITRTWTATDASGNTGTATQTITILDTEGPEFTVPADLTVDCNAAIGIAMTGDVTDETDCDPAVPSIYPTYGNATWNDYNAFLDFQDHSALGGIDASISGWTGSIGHADFSAAPAQVDFRTRTTNTGNVDLISSTMPSNSTIRFDYNLTGVTSDKFIEWSVNGSVFNAFTGTSGTLNVDVASGNSFVLRSYSLVATGRATLEMTNLVIAHSSITPLPLAGCGLENDVARVWSASDACVNTRSKIQLIQSRVAPPAVDFTAFSGGTVIQTGPTTYALSVNPPTNSCQASIVIDANDFFSTTCGSLLFANDANTSFGFGNGTNLASGNYGSSVTPYAINFTATNNCSVATTITLNVTVNDNQAPSAQCETFHQVNINSNPVLLASTLDNGSTDNCGIVSRELAIDSNNNGVYDMGIDGVFMPSLTFGCSDVGTIYSVLMRITDASGNFSICDSDVEIDDNTSASFTFCPPNTIVDCSVDLTLATSAAGPATATHPCATPVITFSDVALTTSAGFCETWERTWSATVGTTVINCTQIINVDDTNAPVISGAAGDVTVECQSVPALASANWTDDCSGFGTVTETIVTNTQGSNATLSSFYNYSQTRRFQVSDCNMLNTTTVTRNVTVQDNTDPVVTTATETYSTDPGMCSAMVDIDLTDYISDNCASLTNMTVNYTFTTAPNTPPVPMSNAMPNIGSNKDAMLDGLYLPGTYVVEFDAVLDPSGNDGVNAMTAQTLTFTIADNELPTPVVQTATTIDIDATSGILTAADVDIATTDNCGIASIALTQTSFGPCDVGVNTVIFIATDIYGNVNFAPITVTVTSSNPGTGFNLAMSTTESSTGGTDGSATATPTGGSGSYNYAWDASTGSQVTATATNLGVGNYFVTVTDVVSGCSKIGLATIDERGLAFTAVNVSGAAGTVVNIPITVTDFECLGAFGLTASITDATVADAMSVVNINPALTCGSCTSGANVDSPNPNDVTFSWFTLGSGVTIMDGEVLFEIQVLLGSVVGSNSPVVVTFNNATEACGAGGITGVGVNGLVSVSSGAATESLSGNIQTAFGPAGAGIDAVDAVISGGSAIAVTNPTSAGVYSYSVSTGASYTVTPEKDPGLTNPAAVDAGTGFAAVTILDAQLTFDYGLNGPSTSNGFSTPYQVIAADANMDMMVNSSDAFLIGQLSVGTTPSGVTKFWEFIPQSHSFSTTFNPWADAWMGSITFPLVSGPVTGDFFGVRIGDVNTTPTYAYTVEDNQISASRGASVLTTKDIAIKAGNAYEVVLSADEFDRLKAYQFGLRFDTNVLELESFDINHDGAKIFNEDKVDLGQLNVAWFNQEAVRFDKGADIVTLTFNAIGNAATLSSVFEMSSEVLAKVGYDESNAASEIFLNFTEVEGTIEIIEPQLGFALYQNRPNPVQNETVVSFSLSEAAEAMITFTDVTGRLLKVIEGDYAKGYNEINLNKIDFPAYTGVVYYQLTSNGNKAVQKLILLD